MRLCKRSADGKEAEGSHKFADEQFLGTVKKRRKALQYGFIVCCELANKNNGYGPDIIVASSELEGFDAGCDVSFRAKVTSSGQVYAYNVQEAEAALEAKPLEEFLNRSSPTIGTASRSTRKRAAYIHSFPINLKSPGGVMGQRRNSLLCGSMRGSISGGKCSAAGAIGNATPHMQARLVRARGTVAAVLAMAPAGTAVSEVTKSVSVPAVGHLTEEPLPAPNTPPTTRLTPSCCSPTKLSPPSSMATSEECAEVHDAFDEEGQHLLSWREHEEKGKLHPNYEDCVIEGLFSETGLEVCIGQQVRYQRDGSAIWVEGIVRNIYKKNCIIFFDFDDEMGVPSQRVALLKWKCEHEIIDSLSSPPAKLRVDDNDEESAEALPDQCLGAQEEKDDDNHDQELPDEEIAAFLIKYVVHETGMVDDACRSEFVDSRSVGSLEGERFPESEDGALGSQSCYFHPDDL